jgi:hypothetical protein
MKALCAQRNVVLDRKETFLLEKEAKETFLRIREQRSFWMNVQNAPDTEADE